MTKQPKEKPRATKTDRMLERFYHGVRNVLLCKHTGEGVCPNCRERLSGLIREYDDAKK